MTRVDVRMIQGALSILENFDKIPFEELELTLDGETLEISAEARDYWKFVGLSNHSFVDLEGWTPNRFTLSEKG